MAALLHKPLEEVLELARVLYDVEYVHHYELVRRVFLSEHSIHSQFDLRQVQPLSRVLHSLQKLLLDCARAAVLRWLALLVLLRRIAFRHLSSPFSVLLALIALSLLSLLLGPQSLALVSLDPSKIAVVASQNLSVQR